MTASRLHSHPETQRHTGHTRPHLVPSKVDAERQRSGTEARRWPERPATEPMATPQIWTWCERVPLHTPVSASAGLHSKPLPHHYQTTRPPGGVR